MTGRARGIVVAAACGGVEVVIVGIVIISSSPTVAAVEIEGFEFSLSGGFSAVGSLVRDLTLLLLRRTKGGMGEKKDINKWTLKN